MKKIIIINLIILAIVAFAFILFDSSTTISNNNEGLRKPDMVIK